MFGVEFKGPSNETMNDRDKSTKSQLVYPSSQWVSCLHPFYQNPNPLI
jgi:hypothetical protein